jgi:hypothetical protein
MPLDTYEYDYKVPTGFDSLKGSWYRKAIVVLPENSDLGTINVNYSMKNYTITWKNWDGKVIYSKNYLVHSTPVFDTNLYPIPTKPDEGQYSYEFNGWDKPIEEVTNSAIYTAVFKEVPRKFTVNIVCDENGTTDITGTTKVEYGSNLTINITPNDGFEIDYIKVNNEIVEITNTLVIENITDNVDIEIEFKSIVVEPDIPDNLPGTDPSVTPNEANNMKLIWIIIGSAIGVIVIFTITTISIIKLKKKNIN